MKEARAKNLNSPFPNCQFLKTYYKFTQAYYELTTSFLWSYYRLYYRFTTGSLQGDYKFTTNLLQGFVRRTIAKIHTHTHKHTTRQWRSLLEATANRLPEHMHDWRYEPCLEPNIYRTGTKFPKLCNCRPSHSYDSPFRYIQINYDRKPSSSSFKTAYTILTKRGR